MQDSGKAVYDFYQFGFGRKTLISISKTSFVQFVRKFVFKLFIALALFVTQLSGHHYIPFQQNKHPMLCR
jgi:hypothetical protein